MPGSKNFPRKLKQAADPRDCFNELHDLDRDVPGARAWGSAERGVTVTVGAGFDFGPLLTFGAPVVTAEVGASVSAGVSQNLIVMLERQGEAVNSLALSVLAGRAFAVSGLVEAKLAVGVPESWTAAAGGLGPKVPDLGLKAKVEAVSRPSPLTDEPEEPEEENTAGLEGELGAEAANERSVEDCLDIALEEEQEGEEADDAADAADNVVDLHAGVKAEASAGLRYLLLRDPAPQRFRGPGPELENAMAEFISETAKAVLQEEAEELLGSATADVGSTKAVEGALAWLTLVPEKKQTPEFVRHLADLNDCKVVAAEQALLTDAAVNALCRDLTERYLLGPDWLNPGSDRQRLLSDFVFMKVDRPPNSDRDWRPSLSQWEQAKKLKTVFDNANPDHATPWQGAAASGKAGWKTSVQGLLKGMGLGQVVSVTAPLLDALRRVMIAGESCNYTNTNAAPPRPDLYDRVTALKAASAKHTWSPDTNAAAAQSKTVVKAARVFIKENVNLVPKPPDTKLIGRRTTAELVAKLSEVAKANPARTDASDLAAELSRVRAGERKHVKSRAAQIVLDGGGTLTWHAYAPSAESLFASLGKVAESKRPRDFVEVRAALADFMAADKPAPPTGREDLTFIAMWTAEAKVAASASAKAKARFAIGPNELGGYVKAAADAEFSAERVSLRLQGFEPIDAAKCVVHTQDVKIIRWAASAKAAASFKSVNRTAAEAEHGVEAGRIRWTGATGRWLLPALDSEGKTSVTAVVLQPGSGLCFGRSGGRGRFVVKLAALRTATTAAAGPIATPYVKRLARALRVDPAVLTRCLLDLFPTAAENPSDEHGTLYFESRWAVAASEFPLRKNPTAVACAALKKAFGLTSDPVHTTPDIDDLRRRLGRKFREVAKAKGAAKSGPFQLQAIAVRGRLGDDPDETEKTLFQIAHEYIVTAQVAVVARTVTRTDAVPDLHTWWADPSLNALELAAEPEARRLLHAGAVPPVFLVDV